VRAIQEAVRGTATTSARERMQLAIKFSNTYLRATINGGDVRMAYSVVHQYRLLAQTLLGYEGGRHSVAIARHFSYYGHVSYTARRPFIFETGADDPYTSNEAAHELKRSVADELLEISSIRDELMRVESPEYWEIIDRGVNFDYLPPERKAMLQRFFGWFGPLPVLRIEAAGA